MVKSTDTSNKKSRKIYLDYASASNQREANPGAIHSLGVLEKKRLIEARKKVAAVLNAQSDEIIFTSGATESNNLAILGLVRATQMKMFSDSPRKFPVENFLCPSPSLLPRVRSKTFSFVPHVITSNIEHASVLEVCRHLEKTKQAEVTYMEVEPTGLIDPQKIKKALRPNTVLVSVMYANNEIGTIEPIKEIAKEIRHYNKINSKKIFFHTDAVQAANYLLLKVPELGVDMMSLNGAKIYGPKGVGALYIKKGVPILPIMFGGNQEFGLRPGTENSLLAAGFAEALEGAQKIKDTEAKRLTKLRDYFITKLARLSLAVKINGDTKNRLPNNVNITIPKIPSDLLVIELSAKGIMVSAKSACKSGESKASHVIEAIRKGQKNTKEGGTDSLRFSLGRGTSKKDIHAAVKALSLILTKLKKWYS